MGFTHQSKQCNVVNNATIKANSATLGTNQMKKPLSYKQRLALHVSRAVGSPKERVYMPYGMEAYVKAAASCMNKKLSYNWG